MLSCFKYINRGHVWSSAVRHLGLWSTVYETVRPVLSPYAVGPLSVSLSDSVTLVYCGQTVGWITMKLGMQVGLGPGHIVLDGDPAPLLKRGQSPPPIFRPMSIVVKRLDGSRCKLVRR